MDRKKDEFSAKCKWCLSEFSIKYEGCRAVNKHLNSQRHVNISKSRAMSTTISKFTVPREINKEIVISRAELACVYHNVVHGLSYNSLDCQVKLCSKIYNDSSISVNMSLGRTKAAAIARNVLAPYAQKSLVHALLCSGFFSISNDASNIGNIKTFPYAVQYFNETNGIEKKILEFYEDPAEGSKDIFKKLMEITKNNNLEMSQVTAYSADNASVNYGMHNSVFQKLKLENERIVKANCNCHVINNCVKNALNTLSCDIENIVIKSFNEFSTSAKKTEKLKQCFDFADIEYKSLLRHVPTRWLSLLPTIDRLVLSWPAVKKYFLLKGKENSRKELWEFVSRGLTASELTGNSDECVFEGMSEAYLYFIQNILKEFQNAILALECDSCTVVEIHGVMNKLLNSLNSRLIDKFYGSKANTTIGKLSEEDRMAFESEASCFIRTSIAYLEKRYDFEESSIFGKISAFNLKNSLFTWEHILKIIEALQISDVLDNDMLYSDYCILRAVYKDLPKDIPNDKIWSTFFLKCGKDSHINLFKLVSFIFSIPTSNAHCERTFSILNNSYTKDRNRMSIDLIKAEIIIRVNICKFNMYRISIMFDNKRGK